MSKPIYLAVFGDVHGHLRLMFQLCRHWQLNTGMHLDGILLCGDLGYFPNLAQTDRATRRYIERDPEEAGFSRFFLPPRPPENDAQLDLTLHGEPDDLNTVDCPALFCHGNHEDFAELERYTHGAMLTPIDAFSRIHFLRSGEVAELDGVRIGALGGKPEDEKAADTPLLAPRVSSQAARRLQRQSFDVLISHGAPEGAGSPFGSSLLAETLARSQPMYNFYGHYSQYIEPATVGRTRCYYHADVNFQIVGSEYIGPPEPNCMAVLRWNDRHDHEYQVVDAPWFRGVTGTTWAHY